MLPRTLLITSGIIVGATLSSVIALAWTGPTGTAPGNNVSAPINVGTTNQVKNGGLSVNALSIFGNALLSGLGVGTGSYLNFDYTSGGTSGTGASGYGIRDNAGTLEFKNSGGGWSSFVNTVITVLGSGAVTQIKFTDGTVQTTAATSTLQGYYKCPYVRNAPVADHECEDLCSGQISTQSYCEVFYDNGSSSAWACPAVVTYSCTPL